MTMKKQAVPTTPSDQLKVRAMQQALSWFPLAALAAGGARGGMGLINSAFNSGGPPIKVPQRQTVLSIPYRREDEDKGQAKIAAAPGLFEDWAHKLTNMVGITSGTATPTNRPAGTAFLAGDAATRATDLPWKQPVSVAAGVLGGAAGYYGVDALMDARRRARLKTDLEEAEDDYNAALTGSRKTATDTAFDEMYDTVEKKALLGNLAGQYLTAAMLAGAVPGVAMYNYTRANSKGKILEEAARRRQQQLFMQTQLPPVARVVPYSDNEKKAADAKLPAATPRLDSVLSRVKGTPRIKPPDAKLLQSTLARAKAAPVANTPDVAGGAPSILNGLGANEGQWQDTLTSLEAPRSKLVPKFKVGEGVDTLKYDPSGPPPAPAPEIYEPAYRNDGPPPTPARDVLRGSAHSGSLSSLPVRAKPGPAIGLLGSPGLPALAGVSASPTDRPAGLSPLELRRPPMKPAKVTIPTGAGGAMPAMQPPLDLIGDPGASHPGPPQSQLSPPDMPAGAPPGLTGPPDLPLTDPTGLPPGAETAAAQPDSPWYQNPYVLGGGALAGGGLLAYLMSRKKKKRQEDEEYA